MSRHGLRPTQLKGDYGHVEMGVDEATRQKALQWVQSGFQDTGEAPAPLVVMVNGKKVEKAGGFLDSDSRARAWVRPVADAMGAVIVALHDGAVDISLSGSVQSIPAQVRENRAYVLVAELQRLPTVAVTWDGQSETVRIKVGTT
jgi:hypothetical protein